MKRYSPEENKADRDLDRERVLNRINAYEDEREGHTTTARPVCLSLSEAKAISEEFGWPLQEVAKFWRRMVAEGKVHHHSPAA